MNPTATVTTDIPMHFRQRGGKTIMLMPDGSRAIGNRQARIDSSMVKVIARGFRWQKRLQDGTCNTINDLAAAEGINSSYISRGVRLAFLSPVLVEAILAGTHPAHLTMKDLMEPFPYDWNEQEKLFGFNLAAGPSLKS